MRFDPNYVNGLVGALNQSSANEQRLTGELSSGLRVSSLPDDPLAAGQAATLSAGIAQDDSFVQNASSTQSLMQVTDSALGSVVTQLTSALSLAVAGSNGTENSADLKTVAQQLSGLRDQVLSLANTSYQGVYVFAGSQGATQPFTLDSSTSPASVTYNGDSSVGSVTTPSGQTIATGVAGSAIFTSSGANVLQALNNLIADFSSGTASSTSSADVDALHSALSNVTQQRAVLDSGLSRLNSASTYAQTDSTNRTATLSNLVSANAATVATDLSSAETQNQALMSVIPTLEKQSLFSYLS